MPESRSYFSIARLFFLLAAAASDAFWVVYDIHNHSHEVWGILFAFLCLATLALIAHELKLPMKQAPVESYRTITINPSEDQFHAWARRISSEAKEVAERHRKYREEPGQS